MNRQKLLRFLQFRPDQPGGSAIPPSPPRLGGPWFDRRSQPMVLHVDVDAFFASVEQLLIPALRNRPVAVGNGVIASCSYEAREFGLRAGTSLREARRKCPSLMVLDGNYQVYRCFAQHIWRICRDYTHGLETFLDEAYGDITGMDALYGDGLTIGQTLQKRVGDEVGLPVSVGAAANRVLAKIASSAAKPNGVRWIQPGQEEDYLAPLPIEKIPGVGRKTARQLDELNIRTVADFRSLSLASLKEMFGKRGHILYERARGRDVQDIKAQTLPKSISRETTFHQPTSDLVEVRAMLAYLLERAMRTLRAQNLRTRCVELNLCYDDWNRRVSRSSLSTPADCDEDVLGRIESLLARLHTRRVSLRHVGIVLTDLSRNPGPRLFEDPGHPQRRDLHRAVDDIRDRWGHASIISGRSVPLLTQLQRNDYGFVLRTPSLTK